MASGQFDSFDNRVEESLGQWYKIQGIIGRGGMAVVYKALQINLNRIVALKVVHENLVHDQEFLGRFLREARVSASLNHQHIVTIHDVGSVGNIHFIAMEYLTGLTLRDYLLEQKRLSSVQTAKLLAPISDALAYIHKRGLVHRDLKPSNIIITSIDRPVLTDFGVVYVSDGNPLSSVGAILGTPEYMSPEQAGGKLKIDGRSDIYSFGTILYECVTGQLPFYSDNPLSTIHQVIYEEPVPVQKKVPTTPGWMVNLILKCHAKDRERRLQTAAELSDILYTHSGNKAAKGISTQLNSNENDSESTGINLIPWAAFKSSLVKLQLPLLVLGIAITIGILSVAFYKQMNKSDLHPKYDPQITHNNPVSKPDTIKQGVSTEVFTGSAYEITSSSAKVKGKITNSGKANISRKGFCWNTNPQPTIQDRLDQVGNGSGEFEAEIRRLKSNTKYYLRAFAISKNGAAYGNQVDFKTLIDESPVIITTGAVQKIGSHEIITSGDIIQSNVEIIERGVCWSNNPRPTLNDQYQPNGSGMGRYSVRIENLIAGMTYYIRAYAKNNNSVYYGEPVLCSLTQESGRGALNADQISIIKSYKMVFVEGTSSNPGFYIGKYEVTQSLWNSIMGTNPSHYTGDSHPVENVSLNEIRQFLDKLNNQTGLNFSIPASKDWVYAASGGNHTRNYAFSGSNNIGRVAFYYENSDNQTHSVGSLEANEIGIYDACGNVWEWCSDGTVRGGCWMSTLENCKINSYKNITGSTRDFCVGFRLFHPEKLTN